MERVTLTSNAEADALDAELFRALEDDPSPVRAFPAEVYQVCPLQCRCTLFEDKKQCFFYMSARSSTVTEQQGLRLNTHIRLVPSDSVTSTSSQTETQVGLLDDITLTSCGLPQKSA